MRFDAAVARLTSLPGRLPAPAESLMPVVVGEAQERWPPFDASAGSSRRAAAVLVLLYPDPEGETRVVLIERASYDGHHAGEVSFPGGKAEPEDPDLVATALREAAEEVGLQADRAGVRIIGPLERFWIPVSDFQVTPILALADRQPDLMPHASEVARILEPSLERFLPDAPIQVVERTIGATPLRYGHYEVDGLSVWGATARVLSQLGAILAAE